MLTNRGKRISLIVATRNRGHYLEKALTSFIEQNLFRELYEIIVIDNASTDNTKDVVMAMDERTDVDIRYLVEDNLGSHNALNRGILVAQGDIIVAGDDDIIACPTWLEAILQEFDTSPTTGIVGGMIKPIWSRQPDEWIFDYGTDKIHGVFAYLDYGNKRKVLGDEYVYGCNFAFRKDIVLNAGGWHPDVYPEHLIYLAGDGEYGIIDSVRKLNYSIVYLPEALVHHHVDSRRCTLDYFIYRYERWAIEWVFTEFRKRSKEDAAKYLCTLALSYVHKAYMECQHKRNPQYFFRIWSQVSRVMIEQTLRVLGDESLYAYIRQESYLHAIK